MAELDDVFPEVFQTELQLDLPEFIEGLLKKGPSGNLADKRSFPRHTETPYETTLIENFCNKLRSKNKPITLEIIRETFSLLSQLKYAAMSLDGIKKDVADRIGIKTPFNKHLCDYSPYLAFLFSEVVDRDILQELENRGIKQEERLGTPCFTFDTDTLKNPEAIQLLLSLYQKSRFIENTRNGKLLWDESDLHLPAFKMVYVYFQKYAPEALRQAQKKVPNKKKRGNFNT